MKVSCGLTLLLLVWVLWTRTQGPMATGEWIGAPGFPTREKCDASMKQKLDVWRQFKDATFGKNSVTFTDTNTTMTYLCLPDTEDPRPKTKP